MFLESVGAKLLEKIYFERNKKHKTDTHSSAMEMPGQGVCKNVKQICLLVLFKDIFRENNKFIGI